jgi:hypothetical protein
MTLTCAIHYYVASDAPPTSAVGLLSLGQEVGGEEGVGAEIDDDILAALNELLQNGTL